MIQPAPQPQVTAHDSRFQRGVGFCWGSLALLPIGLLAIGGGPCAGPRDVMGSVILLGAGLGSLLAAMYGAYGIFRSIRRIPRLMQLFGALSICTALISLLGGGMYLLFGVLSLSSFLRY